jgi:hypothetical protein
LKHIEDSGKMGNNGGVLILTKQVVVIFCFLFFYGKLVVGLQHWIFIYLLVPWNSFEGKPFIFIYMLRTFW